MCVELDALKNACFNGVRGCFKCGVICWWRWASKAPACATRQWLDGCRDMGGGNVNERVVEKQDGKVEKGLRKGSSGSANSTARMLSSAFNQGGRQEENKVVTKELEEEEEEEEEQAWFEDDTDSFMMRRREFCFAGLPPGAR